MAIEATEPAAPDPQHSGLQAPPHQSFLGFHTKRPPAVHCRTCDKDFNDLRVLLRHVSIQSKQMDTSFARRLVALADAMPQLV